MPTISVIVPIYNTEKYLPRCIDSILAQTFTDFELILVDDGSPDNSGAICDEYAAKDSRIRVIHQENQGQAAARNHALDWMFANSDSQYVSFIDSDDWVHPRFLEIMQTGILTNNVLLCQCGFVYAKDELQENHRVSEEYLCVTPKEQYINHYCSFICMNLFNRDIWQSMRFPEGKIYEDLAIWYKILFSQEKIAIANSVLYYYFQSPNSTMRSDWHPGKLTRMDAWDAQIAFFNKHGDEELLTDAVKRYCRIWRKEYLAIERSAAITEVERKKFQAVLRRKIRRLYIFNRKEVQKIPKYQKLVDIAFPIYPKYRKFKKDVTEKVDWCYWTARGILGKPIRILRRLFKK